ncbi:hypothetical protein TREES_T100008678 [Tupaia chinensis]|uniref:Uncharacterized protein n=1 Tax=Tupaia chinensis TaxID=246437 RepID=L9L3K9_TUPCH|nr:hypothetical protein TREES_T100008678 [Tupaia chinensis]
MSQQPPEPQSTLPTQNTVTPLAPRLQLLTHHLNLSTVSQKHQEELPQSKLEMTGETLCWACGYSKDSNLAPGPLRYPRLIRDTVADANLSAKSSVSTPITPHPANQLSEASLKTK